MLISNIITIFFFYRANFEKSGIPFFHVFDHTSFVNALHVTLVWPWGHRSIYVFLKHWMGNTTIWGRYWYELIYWSSVSVGPDLRIFLISFNSIFLRFQFAPLVFKIASWFFYRSCSISWISFSQSSSDVLQVVPIVSKKCQCLIFFCYSRYICMCNDCLHVCLCRCACHVS